MTTEQPPNKAIRIERRYRADLRDLWSLWTTKEGFESWWGPEGFRSEVRRIEPRVGGTLEYSMIADSEETIAHMKKEGMATSHAVTSTFTAVTELQSLELTSLIDFLPGVEAYEVRATVSFHPLGDQVKMVIVLERYHSEEWTMRAKAGWESQLTKFPRALERLRA